MEEIIHKAAGFVLAFVGVMVLSVLSWMAVPLMIFSMDERGVSP